MVIVKAMKALLGTQSKENILVYLLARTSGAATDIAVFFDAPLNPVQKQLKALEAGGLLSSQKVGVRREYRFADDNPLIEPTQALAKVALQSYPDALKTRLFVYRSRPRTPGKALNYVNS